MYICGYAYIYIHIYIYIYIYIYGCGAAGQSCRLLAELGAEDRTAETDTWLKTLTLKLLSSS